MSEKNIVIAKSKKNLAILIGILVLAGVLICVHAWQSSVKTTTDLSVNSSSNQVSATPAASTEKSAETAADSKGNFVISQFGVQASNPGAAELEYVITDNKATFTSKQLLAKSAYCSAKAASAGIIERVPANDFVSSQKYPGEYKQIGDYYYVFTSPQALCSNADGITEPQEAATAAVKSLLTDLAAITAN